MIELVGGLLPTLTSIEDGAFWSFGGKLTIKGSFPLLAAIQEEAFQSAGKPNSVIELVGGLPALTSIGISAFKSFSGTLIIKEKFPLLAAIQAPRLSAVNAKRAAASEATFANEYNMFGFDDDGGAAAAAAAANAEPALPGSCENDVAGAAEEEGEETAFGFGD